MIRSSRLLLSFLKHMKATRSDSFLVQFALTILFNKCWNSGICCVFLYKWVKIGIILEPWNIYFFDFLITLTLTHGDFWIVDFLFPLCLSLWLRVLLKLYIDCIFRFILGKSCEQNESNTVWQELLFAVRFFFPSLFPFIFTFPFRTSTPGTTPIPHTLIINNPLHLCCFYWNNRKTCLAETSQSATDVSPALFCILIGSKSQETTATVGRLNISTVCLWSWVACFPPVHCRSTSLTNPC